MVYVNEEAFETNDVLQKLLSEFNSLTTIFGENGLNLYILLIYIV